MKNKLPGSLLLATEKWYMLYRLRSLLCFTLLLTLTKPLLSTKCFLSRNFSVSIKFVFATVISPSGISVELYMLYYTEYMKPSLIKWQNVLKYPSVFFYTILFDFRLWKICRDVNKNMALLWSMIIAPLIKVYCV